jgi:hypothetical protein
VAMPKDGPVHDVQWSPAGDYFVVVAGFMPAKVRGFAGKRTGISCCGSLQGMICGGVDCLVVVDGFMPANVGAWVANAW